VIRSLPLSILLRVLLPLLVIPLLGVSARWREVEKALNSARQAIEAHEYWPASLAITQATQFIPWRMDLWEQAGILALESDEYPTAQTYLNHAAASGDLSTSGYIALGDAAIMAGDQQSAIQHWEYALHSGEREFELHSRLAMEYRQLRELENAITHQEVLVKVEPTDAELNYELGLLLAASQPESALAYLSLASELNSNLTANAQLLFRNIRSARLAEDQSYLLAISGQSLASIGEWDLAEAALLKSTQINPDYADAWAYLGEARQQNQSGGLKEIQKALEIDPDSVPANTLMGIYWQRKERFALALNYLHAAAKIDQENPALQVEIGNTLGLLGNLNAAETHYQRAVDLSPRDPQYWRSLANFYIRYEINLREEGLAAARQAVILDSSNPESLDLLAQIYLLMDSPYIARRFLEQALKIEPHFAPALLHFGLINILEGNMISAYQNFRLAQEHSLQGSPLSEQVRRLLDTYFP
jgi:Tfp pilus assembly protein PilF